MEGRPDPGERIRHRVGYAGGAFDLFHVGHLNILRHARSQCDYLIAGVASDEVLLRTRGAPAFIPLVERLEIVRHISFVDEAIAETALDKLETPGSGWGSTSISRATTGRAPSGGMPWS